VAEPGRSLWKNSNSGYRWELPFNKTRFVGAAIVAITFLVSLVVLLMDGNIPVSIVTIIMTLLLGAVMKQSWKTARSEF